MRAVNFVLILITLTACGPESTRQSIYNADLANQNRSHLIHQLNRALIGVVSEDLFSPPVASRIYAYSNIAAY